MSRLPSLTPRQVIAALEQAGFVHVRTKGSHYGFQHRSDARRLVIVPYHTRDLPRGTLRDIIKQAGLTVEAFLKLL